MSSDLTLKMLYSIIVPFLFLFIGIDILDLKSFNSIFNIIICLMLIFILVYIRNGKIYLYKYLTLVKSIFLYFCIFILFVFMCVFVNIKISYVDKFIKLL
jgi:hypothetical protein